MLFFMLYLIQFLEIVPFHMESVHCLFTHCQSLIPQVHGQETNRRFSGDQCPICQILHYKQ
jgi:hypothetical protein